MPFRMLHYLVRIWDHHLAEHPTTSRLPAIIPLVVYHNRRAWAGPTELHDLLDLDPDTAEAAREYLPRFRFLLDDLATLDEQVLRQRPLTAETRLTLLFLKAAPGNPHLADDLQPWEDDLLAIADSPGGRDVLTTLVTYIGTVSDTPDHELREYFTRLGPAAEEAYMTTADMLRAEGRAETLLQLLTIKFGHVPQTVRDAVHNATPEQLQTWTARVLTANTLDEVLH